MSIREPTISNHSEAVRFFNRLIIDLQLRRLGKEHEPITVERLNEAGKHIRDIQQCKRPAVVRY